MVTNSNFVKRTVKSMERMVCDFGEHQLYSGYTAYMMLGQDGKTVVGTLCSNCVPVDIRRRLDEE